MSPNKRAYFQGGGGANEPTPGKQKYKSDPALVVQPRFKEPFYHNYDLYTIPGMEDVGPGTGWHSLQNYKSVKDYLNDRRKRLLPRYVADDSWQLDDGRRVNKNPDVKARIVLLERIIKQASDNNDERNYDYGKGLYENMDKFKSVKDFLDNDDTFSSVSQFRSQQDSNNIDFPLDQYSSPDVEVGIDEQADHNTNEIGGFLDDYLPENDFEGKDPSALDFGRDYTEDSGLGISDEDLEIMVEKYLNSSPTHGLYGLPDGVDLPDEDSDNSTNLNPEFGTTDNGNTMYEDKWNI